MTRPVETEASKWSSYEKRVSIYVFLNFHYMGVMASALTILFSTPSRPSNGQSGQSNATMCGRPANMLFTLLTSSSGTIVIATSLSLSGVGIGGIRNAEARSVRREKATSADGKYIVTCVSSHRFRLCSCDPGSKSGSQNGRLWTSMVLTNRSCA
jgi:hypothetical protein